MQGCDNTRERCCNTVELAAIQDSFTRWDLGDSAFSTNHPPRQHCEGQAVENYTLQQSTDFNNRVLTERNRMKKRQEEDFLKSPRTRACSTTRRRARGSRPRGGSLRRRRLI